jgi:hypothetical protein
MSGYRLISSGAVVAKVMRDFNPTNNGWQIDAIEWIADAINEMLLKNAYIPICRELEVKNYRTKIPCNLEFFAGISYDGCRLTPLNSEIPIQSAYKEFAEYNNLSTNAVNHYQINPDYIHFNFESGTVNVYYWGLPLDDLGYPMVPDEGVIKEALSWWVMYKYLLRGGKHPSINWQDAMTMWKEYNPKARNRAKRVTFADMEKMKRTHLTIIPLTRHEYDYYTFLQYYNENDGNGVYLGAFRELNDD